MGISLIGGQVSQSSHHLIPCLIVQNTPATMSEMGNFDQSRESMYVRN